MKRFISLLVTLCLLPSLAFGNDLYTHGSFPSPGSPATSSGMRAELDLITAGFDKFPTFSGNANKPVVVNGAVTAFTVTTGTLSLDGNFAISGAYATTLTVTGATNVTLPTTGTLATVAGSETLTTKTINLTSNTLTGTTAQFNAALSDGDFATLAGSETLTSKTLTSPVLNGTITGSAIVAPANGGTGTSSVPTNGQIPIGNGTTYAAATLTASGTGTAITNGAGAITVTAEGFSTGDVKLTFKTTADSGWVFMNDGTIGDATSGATTRANADTTALYTLLWNNCADADCSVSTGRGANAAADFGAHKTIALPKSLGRALATAGTGSGLTARALGRVLGAEDAIVVSHSHTITDPGHFHTTTLNSANSVGSTSWASQSTSGVAVGVNSDTKTTGITGTNSTGSSGTGANMQPTLFLNIMIKL